MLASTPFSTLAKWHDHWLRAPFGYPVDRLRDELLDRRHKELCTMVTNAPSISLKRLITVEDMFGGASPVKSSRAPDPDAVKAKMRMG